MNDDFVQWKRQLAKRQLNHHGHAYEKEKAYARAHTHTSRAACSSCPDATNAYNLNVFGRKCPEKSNLAVMCVRSHTRTHRNATKVGRKRKSDGYRNSWCRSRRTRGISFEHAERFVYRFSWSDRIRLCERRLLYDRKFCCS